MWPRERGLKHLSVFQHWLKRISHYWFWVRGLHFVWEQEFLLRIEHTDFTYTTDKHLGLRRSNPCRRPKICSGPDMANYRWALTPPGLRICRSMTYTLWGWIQPGLYSTSMLIIFNPLSLHSTTVLLWPCAMISSAMLIHTRVERSGFSIIFSEETLIPWNRKSKFSFKWWISWCGV